MKTPVLLFLAFFGLYLHSASPGLAPYRDSGEMVVSAATLGVSHPPSYPLYVQLGKLAVALNPLAEPAYRLSLLSCAAGAAAVALLYLVLSPYGAIAALAGALALGLNRSFWSVTTVPEMYSLGVLFAVILLWFNYTLGREPRGRGWRDEAFVAFLAGLFLGNRTDLLLWAPAIALLLRRDTLLSRLPRLLCFFLLGLSVYLYLPLRSGAGPLLDWNHPADLWNFWATLTRRSYGGTLDLLSKNYATGELFAVNLLRYGAHLRDSVGWTGLLLAGWGLWNGRLNRLWPALAVAFLASGPLFLFLANLPPNPHALAIIEPHWLLPDVVVCCWLGWGVGELLSAVSPRLAWPILVVFLGEFGVLGVAHHAAACRRGSFYLEDFTRSALRVAPAGSVLVAKKDVQIFGLWVATEVRGRGAHTRVVAQGLAGSRWYQDSMRGRDPALALGALRDADTWKTFLARSDRPVYVTPDAEVEGPAVSQRGPIAAVAEAPPAPWAWEFSVRRGRYEYEQAQDFFAADLIDMAAIARHRTAADLLKAQDNSAAAGQAALAWAAKWVFPDPPLVMGYAAFQAGDLERALSLYQASGRLFDRMFELAKAYRALPDVMAGIRRAGAEAFLNRGVVLDRRKDVAGAEAAYREALERDPASSKAWYNLGTLYWNRDWAKAAEAFRRAAELEPANPAYQNYHRQALRNSTAK